MALYYNSTSFILDSRLSFGYYKAEIHINTWTQNITEVFAKVNKCNKLTATKCYAKNTYIFNLFIYKKNNSKK